MGASSVDCDAGFASVAKVRFAGVRAAAEEGKSPEIVEYRLIIMRCTRIAEEEGELIVSVVCGGFVDLASSSIPSKPGGELWFDESRSCFEDQSGESPTIPHR